MANISGTDLADTLIGSDGDDFFTGLTGDDFIAGVHGIDTASFQGSLAEFTFSANTSGLLIVTDGDGSNGDEGTDTLIGINRLHFADALITTAAANGSPVQVDTNIPDWQRDPNVARLTDGGYVICWEWQPPSGGIRGTYFQRYSADGATRGGPTLVHETPMAVASPKVLSLPDGGWLVFAYDIQYSNVWEQRFDSSGAAVGGQHWLDVETTAFSRWSVGSLGNGNFVINWSGWNAGHGVALSRNFDADGVAQTPATPVDATSADWQNLPVSATLTDGSYVVAWDSGVGSAAALSLQHFAGNGSAIGEKILVATVSDTMDLADHAVVALADGTYVIAFSIRNGGNERFGLHLRHYDASGTQLGSDTIIAGDGSHDYFRPALAALADGTLVVAWTPSTDETAANYSVAGLSFQRLSSDGSLIGGQVPVSADNATLPEMIALDDGGFFLTWSARTGGPMGRLLGPIQSMRFDADGRAQAGHSLTGDGGDNLLHWSGSIPVSIAGGAGADTVLGGSGNDTLAGGDQADQLAGGDGNDLISAGKGLDYLDGGLGNDTLTGGIGNDTLIGGDGTDTASYSTSSDGVTVNLTIGVGGSTVPVAGAGSGTDSLAGMENVTGSSYNDVLTGDGNANRLDGGNGNDNLSGGLKTDTLIGGAGNDTLAGGQGMDSLDGGTGNDVLRGALGTDTLTGGTGADHFIFNSALDGILNIDTITDFTTGSDVIELSATIFTTYSGQIGSAVGLGNHLSYSTATGVLAYDADGIGGAAALTFAILGTSSHPVALGNDFLIVA